MQCGWAFDRMSQCRVVSLKTCLQVWLQLEGQTRAEERHPGSDKSLVHSSQDVGSCDTWMDARSFFSIRLQRAFLGERYHMWKWLGCRRDCCCSKPVMSWKEQEGSCMVLNSYCSAVTEMDSARMAQRASFHGSCSRPRNSQSVRLQRRATQTWTHSLDCLRHLRMLLI